MMDTKINFVPLPSGVAHPGPRRMAVASGKGGVGKTWLAITLAHALTQNGTRVLLFDGDLGLANADIQLGLTPSSDLGAVLANRLPISDAITLCPPCGFDMLAGRSGSGTLAALEGERLDALLAELGALPYEVIVLDLGAGLHANTRRLAAWADTLIVVATDEPTSLTDAYAVLKLHAADRPGGDARIVVNQAASAAEGNRTFETLARACQQFLGRTPPFAGIVRRDQHVRDTIRRQIPLLTRHPGCHAALDVHRIASQLT